MKSVLISLPFIATCLHVSASGNVMVGYDYTDYSGSYGSRSIAFAEIVNRLNNGAVALNISNGKRDYGNGTSFTGTMGRGTLWYNWTPSISTRTGLTVADNSPVFVRQDFFGDINFNLIKQTTFLVGARHAQYYGRTDVNTGSTGVSIYSGPVITSYRYSLYHTTGKGNSDSHLVSLKLKDPRGNGSTQLWMSTGTGAYTYDWMPGIQYGKLHTVSLKRNQPLTKDISLGALLGKQWYETPLYSYSGIAAHLSLSLNW